jgi:hypothetical protein
MLFREIKDPRCILFGMKTTKTEADWLRTRALTEGISKSALVRRLLADVANKDGDNASQEKE